MKVLIYILGGLAVAALAVVGFWIYASSQVEEPDFALVLREDAFELRDYPALVVAEVRRDGARDDAVRDGFRALAGYIFARERPGEKIAMTAPVTQIKAGDSDWLVRFVMPKDATLADLPKPAGVDVTLVETAPTRMAALRFSGSWSDDRFAEEERKLRDWMTTRKLRAVGPPTIAYYNDPFTPPFLRRNEILIPVENAAEE